jgi:hypothetical protein
MLQGGFGANAPVLNSSGLDYRGGQEWDSCGEREKDMRKRSRGQIYANYFPADTDTVKVMGMACYLVVNYYTQIS